MRFNLYSPEKSGPLVYYGADNEIRTRVTTLGRSHITTILYPPLIGLITSLRQYYILWQALRVFQMLS